MRSYALLLFLIIQFLVFPYKPKAQPGSYTLSKDSMVNVYASQKRIYNTVRTTNKPKIDGILDDSCWENEGVWAGDFVQQQPNQAKAPSQKTEVKILYDNDNLYIAFKCHDNEPNGIRNLLGRRDDFTVGDIAGVALDSYHDKRTAFEFNVTAAGQKVDLMHLGAYMWDPNWNAVWDGKAHVADSLWTIEMRVPFSQLRFSDENEQVWGMHIYRFISRTGEEDQWKLIPIDAPAMVYIFGELHGIKDIPKKRHFEVMPYTALRYISGQNSDDRFGFGVDGKAALSSNFMLDYTVYPDFGQVEADPSELNLTSYEVFYQEKRPFFLEGNAILEYGIGNDMLFYSRRIGHAPTFTPALSSGQTLEMPSSTNILNAIKVTGKTKDGFSLGIVNGMTQQEFATVKDASGSTKYAVEPFTNYFVARAKQDYNKGNTVIGGIFTSALRSIKADHLKEYLPSESFAGGVDVLHSWKNRKYFMDFKSFFSNISGSQQSITRLQQCPIHLYQRTDATHLSVDQSATSMSGWGGEIQGGKQSGKFRAIGNLSWRSPGLDLNDVGYLREADIVTQRATLKYQVNKPKGIIRNYTFGLEQRHDWSFGGENIFDLLENTGQIKFTNLWQLDTELAHCFNKIDTRQLRGGDALRKDPHSIVGLLLSTDATKKLSGGIGFDQMWADNNTSNSTDYKLNFQIKFSNRFTVTSNTYFEKLTDNDQFVPSPTLNIAGRINRKTLYTTLRAEYFVTPELSLQYYGSPYSSVGKFSKIYKVADSKAKDPDRRYSELKYLWGDQENQYYREQGSSTIWTISKPDFNFQEFRSNFVLRWEYKAGSTLYFVWSHNRSSYESEYNSAIFKSFDNLSKVTGNNALMIKFSYWFSL